jgi:hypothetical protein
MEFFYIGFHGSYQQKSPKKQVFAGAQGVRVERVEVLPAPAQ